MTDFLVAWAAAFGVILLTGVALVALFVVLLAVPCLFAAGLEKCGLSEEDADNGGALLTLALAISFAFAYCSVR